MMVDSPMPLTRRFGSPRTRSDRLFASQDAGIETWAAHQEPKRRKALESLGSLRSALSEVTPRFPVSTSLSQSLLILRGQTVGRLRSRVNASSRTRPADTNGQRTLTPLSPSRRRDSVGSFPPDGMSLWFISGDGAGGSIVLASRALVDHER